MMDNIEYFKTIFQKYIKHSRKFFVPNSRVGLLKRAERKGDFSLEIKYLTTYGIGVCVMTVKLI